MAKPTEVYAPQQVGELALAEVRNCIEWADMGVRMGLANVDQDLRPLRPGNLCVVQGYTSNFKSGFMRSWARRLAENIRLRGGTDRVVVLVSWEDTVEEIGLFDLSYDTGIDASMIQAGRVSAEAMARLEGAAFRRGSQPLWVVGNSLALRKAQARLTMSQCETLLAWIEDEMGVSPLAIFLDYLNKVQPESKRTWGDNRRTDMMELAYRASELAFKAGCPVIAGAQSNRVTNERHWKLPQAWDCMESSAIEQYSQVVLSLWMPSRTEVLGSKLRGPDNHEMSLVVDEHLLILGINKQKRGPAGGWWPLYIDAGKNIVAMREPEDLADDVEPIRF